MSHTRQVTPLSSEKVESKWSAISFQWSASDREKWGKTGYRPWALGGRERKGKEADNGEAGKQRRKESENRRSEDLEKVNGIDPMS
jgi:hypothetical protein